MQALDTAPQKLECIVAKWLNQLTSCRLNPTGRPAFGWKVLELYLYSTVSIKSLLVSGLSSEWYGIVDL